MSLSCNIFTAKCLSVDLLCVPYLEFVQFPGCVKFFNGFVEISQRFFEITFFHCGLAARRSSSRAQPPSPLRVSQASNPEAGWPLTSPRWSPGLILQPCSPEHRRGRSVPSEAWRSTVITRRDTRGRGRTLTAGSQLWSQALGLGPLQPQASVGPGCWATTSCRCTFTVTASRSWHRRRGPQATTSRRPPAWAGEGFGFFGEETLL